MGKTIWAVIIIVLLVVAGSIFYFSTRERTEPPAQGKLLEGTGSTASEITSISECNALTNDPAKDNCFLKLAVSKKDISICDMMPIGGFSALRHSDCYGAVGKEVKEASLCDNLDEEVGLSNINACYNGVAIGSLDESLCIKGSGGEDNCYLFIGVAKGDLSICDMIVTGKKWTCYMNIGINTGDASICDMIEDNFVKEACHNTV